MDNYNHYIREVDELNDSLGELLDHRLLHFYGDLYFRNNVWAQSEQGGVVVSNEEGIGRFEYRLLFLWESVYQRPRVLWLYTKKWSGHNHAMD